jgi:hypothetical protein
MRLHSALATPAGILGFAADSRIRRGSSTRMPASLSFLRHDEIYSDGQTRREAGAGAARPAHSSEWFPTGYSLTGCSRAEPASASPVNLILQPELPFPQRLSAHGNRRIYRLSQRRAQSISSRYNKSSIYISRGTLPNNPNAAMPDVARDTNDLRVAFSVGVLC